MMYVSKQAYSGDPALIDRQDWLKLKVDFYKRFGASARITFKQFAANYMSYVGSDGRLDQILYADPGMW